MSVGEVNNEGLPLDTRVNMRLSRVCGLAVRQRVSLTLQGFDELTENEKDELFKKSIQAYVQYPEELKKKGKKLAMKIISHAWTSYKTKHVKIWRNQDTSFATYKDLSREDWSRFVKNYKSEKFAVNSEYMQWLRSQNELDHHHNNIDYAEKHRRWQQEDERLTQLGLQNPFDNFRGRLGPFMCAHSKLIESGDVSFHSQSTTDVAQRALRESSKDSNGERENDALSNALQTKEQRGRVRGVSSKMTWKEGFLKHKSMYLKRKTTSTPHVDVEELRRELLADLRPIMEASVIQFPNIDVVMSDEERRTSLASLAAGGGWPHEDLHAPAFGPSIELGTIDNLAQPTTSIFKLFVGGSFRMEVGRVLLYLCQTMLDDVQIDTSSYAVVKVDMVHDNS
jgi:hypothetical protein